MGLLRILLAISVLTAHLHGKSILGFRLVHGDLAVQSFFMISGFYMALVLNQKYRPGEYWVFLQQRWLRLMPVYWLILGINVLATLFVVPLLPREALHNGWLQHAGVPNAGALAWLGFFNLFIVGDEWLYFFAVDPGTGSLVFSSHAWEGALSASNFILINPAWTLSLEMVFYLMAPFLVRLSWRAQAALVLASLALRWICVSYFRLHLPFFDNHFFPFELGFFLAGSIAYQAYRHYTGAVRRAASRWQWARWFFYGIVIAYSRLPGPDSLHYHLFIIVLFFMLPVLFTLTSDVAWDRYTGELSYSFYLAHPVVLLLTQSLVTRWLPENRWGIAYLLLCLCFSYLLYRFFEAKVDRWRAALLERRSPPHAGAGVSATS